MSHTVHAELHPMLKWFGKVGKWIKGACSLVAEKAAEAYQALKPTPSIGPETKSLHDYCQERNHNTGIADPKSTTRTVPAPKTPIKRISEGPTPKTSKLEQKQSPILEQPKPAKQVLVKTKAPIRAEPTSPKQRNCALPTFMTDLQHIADAFQIVANREQGDLVDTIKGIESGINDCVNIAMSTSKLPQGLGILASNEGTSFVWNKSSSTKEAHRLRAIVQKVYLAITAIVALQDNLGYTIQKVDESENAISIEAVRDRKWITIFLNATSGEVLTDFGNFSGVQCFQEAKVLVDAMESGGVGVQPLAVIPKDNSGVPLFDQAQGDITIMDPTDKDRHLILEALRRSGMDSAIKFDSRCG